MTDLRTDSASQDVAGRLWLASGSPQRLALLRQIGIEPSVVSIDLDESALTGEAPANYVHRLALAKAHAGLQRVSGLREGNTHDSGALHAPPVVIGADTTIDLDGHILTKPDSEADAIDMLLRLSGREHTVLTGTAIVTGPGTVSAVVSTRVTFGVIRPEDARWYVATGEPMNKAGSYGIQGLGARFVASLEGSYSNVVGLPLYELMQLLRESGLDPNMIHV